MRPFFHALGVVVVACSVAACGSSDKQTAADAAQKSSEQTQKGAAAASQGAQDMAKGFEAMAKGLAAAAGGGADGVKPVDPVSFRELQTVMPEISGWERKNPTVGVWSKPRTGQFTTVSVGVSVTCPSALAWATSSAERRVRGCPLVQLTLMTCHRGV